MGLITSINSLKQERFRMDILPGLESLLSKRSICNTRSIDVFLSSQSSNPRLTSRFPALEFLFWLLFVYGTGTSLRLRHGGMLAVGSATQVREKFCEPDSVSDENRDGDSLCFSANRDEGEMRRNGMPNGKSCKPTDGRRLTARITGLCTATGTISTGTHLTAVRNVE